MKLDLELELEKLKDKYKELYKKSQVAELNIYGDMIKIIKDGIIF